MDEEMKYYEMDDKANNFVSSVLRRYHNVMNKLADEMVEESILRMRKRKRQNPWDKLDDVMVETVLAKLPMIDIFQYCQFVCKRWRSIIHCSTFATTSKQLRSRHGHSWFIMFDISNLPKSSLASYVYDMEVSEWRRVDLLVPIPAPRVETPHFAKLLGTYFPTTPKVKILPVASSGGFICFNKPTNETDCYSLIVNNPLTGVSRSLPEVQIFGACRGIAMRASESKSGSSTYNFFVVYGNLSYLHMKVYSSSEDDNELPKWKEISINQTPPAAYRWTDMRELVGVTSLGSEGQILIHYLERDSGLLISIDTLKGTFFTSRSLPYDYLLTDLVECSGRIFQVHLKKSNRTEPLITVQEFDHENEDWKFIGSMPPEKFRDYFDKIGFVFDTLTCSGHGDYIMVSVDSYFVLMYNIKENTWAELPPCFDDEFKALAWTCSLKPDIEAKV